MKRSRKTTCVCACGCTQLLDTPRARQGATLCGDCASRHRAGDTRHQSLARRR